MNNGTGSHQKELIPNPGLQAGELEAKLTPHLEILRSVHGQVDPPPRYRALESAEPHQQLQAALRQIDDLLKENNRLKKSIEEVGRAVTEACRLALHEELTGALDRRRSSNCLQTALNRVRRQIETIDH